ncbi:hypothetical protein FHS43_002417 [Streptosporangium becharense]|uniref:Uncharacterized protein n=1 Tax=Streptosporangium becharense TaxID=1816182 RepID=A0A7W9IJD1_9ACTN|nr:hypothetical protein [Streptosporangium becharense]MBB2911152.1 hypothetical protein [Streptosporangium becharense]MBB5821790.1 hypothetical protein [Streptosporangium becharense]
MPSEASSTAPEGPSGEASGDGDPERTAAIRIPGKAGGPGKAGSADEKGAPGKADASPEDGTAGKGTPRDGGDPDAGDAHVTGGDAGADDSRDAADGDDGDDTADGDDTSAAVSGAASAGATGETYETTVRLRLPAAPPKPDRKIAGPGMAKAPGSGAGPGKRPDTGPGAGDGAVPGGPEKAVRAPATPLAAPVPPAAYGGSPAGSRPQGVVAPAPAPARQSRRATLMQSAATWLPPLLTIEGLVMYVLALRAAPGPLRGVDLTEIDGLGLISALPVTAFAAIILMLVAFFVTVAQNTDRKFLLLFQIAAITFALHGAAALIEDEARFPTAYVHAGFVEYINRTGEASPILDARFAWPGFFALVAFVTKAAGVTDLSLLMKWTPLLSNLLYLLPFVVILRQVVATTRARWFAALLFVIVQWIGQDYLSSQGFTYAIYLAFVAIVLRWFGKVEPRDKPMPAKGRIRRLLARLDGLTPGELPHATGVYDRSIMLIVLIGLFVTATASHQITPFMMLGALTGLILLRRSSVSWALPFFLGLVVLSWISYQTVTFWSGHIDQLFGGLGRILENLQSNTGDRIDGSDPKHALVLSARLGILVAILSLAAVGLLRRLRRGVGDRAALLLLCIPVLALGLQSYGGEIGLRIYLFALPGACILAAYAFFPNLPAGTEDASEETVPIRRRNIRFNPQLTRRISLLLASGCAVVLAMAFLVARYGNEQFERVSASEVAAMHYVYDHDDPSARILYLVPLIGPEVTPIIPWGERDFDKISYEQVLVDKNPEQLSSVIDKLRVSPPNTFLVTTRGQAAYLQLNHGYPADWAQRFRAALDAHKELKRVFTGDEAAVYTLKTYPKNAEIPERGSPTGGNDPTSPWTPVGLAALAVTWIALFTYEAFHLRGAERTVRARRRVLYLAVPAFLVAVGVIAERFIVIGYQIQ